MIQCQQELVLALVDKVSKAFLDKLAATRAEHSASHRWLGFTSTELILITRVLRIWGNFWEKMMTTTVVRAG